MAAITTFVIFDMETTGLPYQEHNRTKATEMCFIAIHRRDIQRAKGSITGQNKLSFTLNPKKHITPGAVALNQLTNDKLQYSPTFARQFTTLYHFLESLEKPVCLVAHNGNTFDFKILLAECKDAGVMLPNDLYCVDSLVAFRQLDKIYQYPMKPVKIRQININDMFELVDELLTDDEDDVMQNTAVNKMCYKLTSVFDRAVGVYELSPYYESAHRAEDDCNMLLDCIVSYQSHNVDFVKWADENCKLLIGVKPLNRK